MKNKKISFFILASLILFGCGNDAKENELKTSKTYQIHGKDVKVEIDNEENYRDSTFYNKQGLKDGWSFHFSQSNLEYQRYYINGKLEGWTAKYYPNGKIRDKYFIIDNKKYGSRYKYFDNGDVYLYHCYDFNGDNRRVKMYDKNGHVVINEGLILCQSRTYSKQIDTFLLSDNVWIDFIVSTAPHEITKVYIVDFSGKKEEFKIEENTVRYKKKYFKAQKYELKIFAQSFDTISKIQRFDTMSVLFVCCKP